ncbi:MAG: hypothetical protein EZS28_011914 [Streblomastix strix]|uniref:MCM9 N-terminal domain-containing protein n=1 Tax=Streblomastix strix TaxID=222440 RepID=A0A5J4WC87_9EUKA|nr:MAG: hypothetical protein EZS28_011914 [Streblomastix strix]
MLVAWMADQIPDRDVLQRLYRDFLVEHCRYQIERIVYEHSDNDEHYGIRASMMDLTFFDVTAGQYTLLHATDALDIFEIAAREAQELIRESGGDEEFSDAEVKEHVHIRLHDLPCDEGTLKGQLPRAEDIGSLVGVQGTVIRTGIVKMLMASQTYICKNCHRMIICSANAENSNEIT